jgi:hypothetical protein
MATFAAILRASYFLSRPIAIRRPASSSYDLSARGGCFQLCDMRAAARVLMTHSDCRDLFYLKLFREYERPTSMDGGGSDRRRARLWKYPNDA